MTNTPTRQFSQHLACQTLTGFTLAHLPRDGSLGRVKRYRKGAVIWHPDDRADRIYFLQRGQVAVLLGDADGHEVILRMIGVGEPFGELCFCTQEHGVRHTEGHARTDSDVLEIKHTDFVSYVQRSRDTLTAFLFTFCEQLSDMERRVAVLAHRGAEARLGHLLLHLAHARGTHEGKVVLYVSHAELAQMAAMSRAHVTVTLGRFRQRGVVQYARNRPLVVNVPVLKAHVNEA